MMWTPDELRRIGEADELQLSSTRPDGTDRPFVTIWAVTSGGTVYVRSAYGPDNPWYRRALAARRGRIRAGGVDREVTFQPMAPLDLPLQLAVDSAYHLKYAKHPPRIVSTVVGLVAQQTTIRIDPR
ncbi:hypothetical protein LK09_18295 [Microbacterium mangrovi]|uniref:DUF2255 family protein n=1 Tax=Microbacterium mangrovi TaxID=1348253 RepID=A0A0B2A212_9MICO|nr:DUF2255 family protein [Microbacterium mangrovi]KHK95632.1 hypothetical protein LK09_18295 [Microbacterium mangrovi]